MPVPPAEAVRLIQLLYLLQLRTSGSDSVFPRGADAVIEILTLDFENERSGRASDYKIRVSEIARVGINPKPFH